MQSKFEIHIPTFAQALVDAQERAGETETELDRKKGLSRGTSLAREF